VSPSNSPSWGTGTRVSGPFQEVWYLKMNDPAAQRALWLRFTLLVSDNGFRRIAETWAIHFQRQASREVGKLALKQTYGIEAYSAVDGGIRIGESEFRDDRTRGKVSSKGRSIEWDLAIAPARALSFDLVPPALSRSGLVKNSVVTVGEDLRFTGTVRVDGGESFEFQAAPGMQGHLSGPRNGHSWVWGHCNTFRTDSGAPADFVFEGISARSRLGPLPSPKLSAFFFSYQGRDYAFNSLWDAVRLRSRNSLLEWTFAAERGELCFRGSARAEHKDFAGLTYEDTDGSLLYCANSKLSDVGVHVYRRGKLEASFQSDGAAAFEVVSRQKNPYVPLLI
jgi:hypothetical protein